MARPPWSVSRGTEPVIAEWLNAGKVRACLAAERSIPAREARPRGIPKLAPGLVEALRKRGVDELYDHQVRAIEAATGGKNVLIATPTASGKSFCFHLPVLEALARDPGATALFLYPTKALSRDQEHNLLAMTRDSGLAVPSIVFDGDTPGDVRRVAREKGRIILTNPDMLHAGILPNHAKWASFFQGLRYVVFDEMHTYRGVFGSHMAHVVTRLRRIARFHGADPKFIGATATIGNPAEHAQMLLGVPSSELEVITESGAPSAARRVFVYNPPVVNAELGVRASTLKAAVHLTKDLVLARVPTIVFGPSRNSVETMLKYLRDECREGLAGSSVNAERAIMAYRGGYLPEMRREIERGLREGEILCVVATSALELGIDIGDLDAVVCAGYPGSVAGTWQRFGRAGRRGRESIALLVCGSSALDQYLAREPAFLLDGGSEHARIDPSNTEILIQHLKCAAFEAPFRVAPAGEKAASPNAAVGEGFGHLDPESTRDALEFLAGHGLVHASRDRYHWASEAFPASSVSLRSIGWDNFVIIDQGTPESPTERIIGELDYRATHTMLHEQAIYQQDAEQYQVERLDFDNHKAFVRKVAPDYFTTALTYRRVTILDTQKSGDFGPSVLGFGDVKVVEKVTGYKKIKFFTHENSGYGDVHLPEMEMHTQSLWLTLPDEVLARVDAPRGLVVDGLRGVGHALEAVSALVLLCDPRDIGQTLVTGEAEAGSPSPERVAEPLDPTLFLFDAQPGGVGLSERLYDRMGELLGRALVLVEGCPCSHGCPACVGPTEDGPRKSLALWLLAELGAERPPVIH